MCVSALGVCFTDADSYASAVQFTDTTTAAAAERTPLESSGPWPVSQLEQRFLYQPYDLINCTGNLAGARGSRATVPSSGERERE